METFPRCIMRFADRRQLHDRQSIRSPDVDTQRQAHRGWPSLLRAQYATSPLATDYSKTAEGFEYTSTSVPSVKYVSPCLIVSVILIVQRL